MFVYRSTSTFPAQSISAVSQLSELRTTFAEWLADAGVDSERLDDLSVVLSELGANAVRETPDGAQPADVSARLDGNRLELIVSNEVSPDAVAVEDWDLDDPLRTGGRGLLLVSAFVDEIDVDVIDRRLVVTCAIQF